MILLILLAALQLGGCASVNRVQAFTSDGCSLFPDGTLTDRALWCDCCFNHDIAYWRGGGEDKRKAADKELHACVLELTGNKTLAEAMYEGVRLGGSPVLPTWYRWGYGWKYGRGYQPLTEEEQQQAAAMLSNYKVTHPSGYCRKQ